MQGILSDVQRDTLLIRLDERTARADKALFGNGGGPAEGLVSRVAVLEERTPPDWERKIVKIGIPTALVTGVLGIIKQHLGL